MSVVAHPSTSPPSAKQALSTVVEQRAAAAAAASHTQSLGLLSPIPSSTSITSIYPQSPSGLPTPFASSSASSFTSDAPSSPHHAPSTPRTPLRSATIPKPRPSPLFRLLQPFARVLPPTTPTMSQPPSPTQTSSRSERLLRDALKRDEMERQSTSTPPLAVPQSPPNKGHRRRHSHIPTSTFSNTVLSSSPERDEYTRGTFLFRTAMSNPRSPSHSHSPARASQPLPIYYGGDAERAPTAPLRRHRQTHSQSVSYQRAPTATSRSRSRSAASPRSTSHSPSPLRRRPSPLPLDRLPPAHAASPSGLRRATIAADEHVSENIVRRPRSRQGRAAPGEPLVMTPHEQVLRARLERVLSVGRGVERGEREKQRARRAHQRSMSQENEVRDEDGGWPWREREDIVHNAGASTTAGPLNSAQSNQSSTSSSHSPQFPARNITPTLSRAPVTARVVSHSRTRSKTDPMSPPLPSSLGPARASPVPSPRRSSTEPSRIPRRKQSVPPTSSPLIPRTGTTPPLVPGEDADGEDGEDGDMRLLTPPPTPPFTSRAFSLAGTPGNGGDGYCPSPYKSAYSPVKPLASRKATGLAPRRPLNAPLRGALTSSSDHEHEPDSSSCSSGGSQASFPASTTSSGYARRRQRQRSRSADVRGDLAHAQRPQFNARKASARCRAIEGYVSFASVEGLGEPPADPLSPDGAEREHQRGRSAGVLGAAWGGWKKLLNVAGLEGHPVKDGGVVL